MPMKEFGISHPCTFRLKPIYETGSSVHRFSSFILGISSKMRANQ
jgi:hypothetical protein